MIQIKVMDENGKVIERVIEQKYDPTTSLPRRWSDLRDTALQSVKQSGKKAGTVVY